MNGNRIVYTTWFIIMGLMLYIEFKPEDKKQVETYIGVFHSGQGKVYCREPYQTTWDSMNIGDRLSPGSHVATGPQSAAIIVLKDGHEIKLEENSQVNLSVANDVSQNNYLVDVIQGKMQVAKTQLKPQTGQSVFKTVFKNITEKPANFKSVKSFFTNIVKPQEKGIDVTTKDIAVNIPDTIKALNINATGTKTKFTTEDGKVFVPPVKENDTSISSVSTLIGGGQNTKADGDQLAVNEVTNSESNNAGSAAGADNELELSLESKISSEFGLDQAEGEKSQPTPEIDPDTTSENTVPIVVEAPPRIKMEDLPTFQKNEKRGYDGVVIWEENFLAIEPLLNIAIKASKGIPKEHTYILKIWPAHNESEFENIKSQVNIKNELKFVVPKAKFINWLNASPSPFELKWGLYLTNDNSDVSNKELFRDSFQFFSVPHLKGNYFEVKIDSSKKPPSSQYTYFRNNITNPTSSYNIADKSMLRKIAEGQTKDHIVEIKIKEPPIKTDKNVVQTLFVNKGKIVFSSEESLTEEKIAEMVRELGADFAFKGKPSDIFNSQQILQNSIGNGKKVQANFLTLTSHYPTYFNYKSILNVFYGAKALSQSDNIFLRERPEIFTAVPHSGPDPKLKSLLTAGADAVDSGEKMVAFLNIDKNSGLSWKKKADIKLLNLRGFRDANPQMISANFVVNGISLSSFFKKEKDDKKIFDFIEKIAKCDLLIVSKELSEKDVQISLFYKEATNQTFHLQMDLLEKAQIPRWVYESLGYDATAGAQVIDSYIYLSNYPKKILKSNQGFIWPNSAKSVFFNTQMQIATPFLFQCETADERGCIAKILTNNKSKIPDLSDSKVTLLGRKTLQDSQKTTGEISH